MRRSGYQLESYLAADPEDRSSRLGLAEVLVRSSQLEESEALLRPLPDSDPDARVLRVRIALGRSRLDEVRSLLDARAGGACRARPLTQASSRYERTIRRRPPGSFASPCEAIRPTGRRSRACPSSFEAGQADQAAVYRGNSNGGDILTAWLEKVRDLQAGPNSIRIWPTHLGEACEDVDRPAEARAWYRLALPKILDPALRSLSAARSTGALHRLRNRPADARGPATVRARMDQGRGRGDCPGFVGRDCASMAAA